MALESAQAELSSIQDLLAQARSEMETIKAVATVSENTKQEAIDQVRSQWQEEVASLQAIMKGRRGRPGPRRRSDLSLKYAGQNRSFFTTGRT